MKIHRVIQIGLYAVIFMIIGSLVYQALFERGGGRGGGFGYGNLWLRYSIEERGIRNPKVQWLIATPEMPTNQTYRRDEDHWTFTFASGKTHTFNSDPENLIWIDPTSGVTKLPAELTAELIKRIDQTQDQARGKRFGSGSELLSWLAETNAEQAGADQPTTAPKSNSEGDSKPQLQSEGRSQ